MKYFRLFEQFLEEKDEALLEATENPKSYNFNNPGDEWKNILTKAMQRFSTYSSNKKVIKDTMDLLMTVYKLGAKEIGKKMRPETLESLASNLVKYDRKGIMNGSADDLIAYIKNDLDPNALPNWADSRAQKDFKSGKWTRITPQTKLQVDDEIVRINDIMFAVISKIEGDKVFIQFAIDYDGEKPTKKSREVLEDYYLLIKK
jgi:hypothetical protein